MYFESRAAAGQQLADELTKTVGDEPSVVVALSSGAVVVGEQIAARLDCPIVMLLTEEVMLPQEPTPVGGITSGGVFSYNTEYTDSQLEEFIMEYHGVIEQDKLNKLQRLHREVSQEEIISPSLLKRRNVILVSDGISGGFVLDLAMTYLKPIPHKKVIIATPFADVPAVDRMHIMADGIVCLNVLENYISTDHYYDLQDSLDRTEAVEHISRVLRDWYASRPLSELEELKRASPRASESVASAA